MSEYLTVLFLRLVGGCLHLGPSNQTPDGVFGKAERGEVRRWRKMKALIVRLLLTSDFDKILRAVTVSQCDIKYHHTLTTKDNEKHKPKAISDSSVIASYSVLDD